MVSDAPLSAHTVAGHRANYLHFVSQAQYGLHAAKADTRGKLHRGTTNENVLSGQLNKSDKTREEHIHSVDTVTLAVALALALTSILAQ